MDSSIVEDVYEDQSSDNYSPEPKPSKSLKVKAPVAAKKAPAKASTAPKKLTQTTLKTVKAPSKKRAKPESDIENSDPEMDDDSFASNASEPQPKKPKKAAAPKKTSKPLAPVNNETVAGQDDPDDESPKSKPKKVANGSQAYTKLTQVEHILKRPDTYVGSVVGESRELWIYNSELDRMEFREVHYVPALYKIFDEILVNAADNKQNDKNMDEIKVTIDREIGEISVWNNGRGIPIEMHQKENVWIPELIFGHLLTSSNYDDEKEKTTGGRNGFGAKLTNIYSTHFSIETVDSKRKQKYKQTWTKNMSVMGNAKITDYKGEDYTKVTFQPDFSKFEMQGMDEDFEGLVKRRVYDMAGTCKDVKVMLNGDRIKVRTFKKYMEMYTKALAAEKAVKAEDDKSDIQVILTDNPHQRWEIGFAVSDGSFQQVSFVNSIATTIGGTHVNYIADQIVSNLAEIVKKKNKGGVVLKPNQIRNHLFLFVNCLITNPSFNSQTKEQLTTKPSQFGSKCTLSDKFLKDIAKTEAVQNIIHFAQQKADQLLKKSDGNRRTRMNNSKLTDANKAGTKDGHRCTLILTEGESASLLALAGRAVVDPDLIGVFPLRGKLLNVRDASVDQISKNAEIQNIKKFMGLQHKKHYDDTKSLRYGHLMIMTDQDHDGSHIKGLLINFLELSYPSLLKIPGFLQEFITPIVKVWKGDPKHPKHGKAFFTMPEYETWKEQPGNDRGWDHKYFKGLGTSAPADAEVYFRDLDRHLKEFHVLRQNEQINESELIELAFSKKKADARKEWLRQFVPGTYLDMTTARITYDDFINKELILFSMADNMRSIPSVIDGFKPGQRKALYTCFRRNLKKDIKVVELAGSVSGLTAYAHGETSLQQTIVGLAQTFVGSNNVNCLEPSGNFGSRLQGGSDCAAARYIYTRLSPFARKIFHQTDEALLTYNIDDGKTIEPEVYCPILPMILVNGADGIGTGWSTSIPNYNPREIVENLKLRMNGTSKDDMKPMAPWFRGWTNEATIDSDKFRFTGTIQQTGDLEVEITELPVRMWTQDFKDRLEEIIKAEKAPSFIKDYTEYNTPTKVHFIIKIDGEKHMKAILDQGLENTFKLSKTMSVTNLVAFDHEGRIHKYATVLDMMEEFYRFRLKKYSERKRYLLNEMEKELDKLNNQAKFIKMIVDGKLVVSKKKKIVLVAELREKGFLAIPKSLNSKKQGEFEPVVEEESAEEVAEDLKMGSGAHDYDYLLGMAIWSLTQERIDKLMSQIGDKTVEMDTLIKTSEKQLWINDLDNFLAEWEASLADEATRAKEISRMGRRESKKLRIGAKGSKKRRANDSDSDDDFEFGGGPAKVAKTTKSKAADMFKHIEKLSPPPKKAVGVKAPAVKKANGLLGDPVANPPAVVQGLLKPEPDVMELDHVNEQRSQPTNNIKRKNKNTFLDDSDEEMEESNAADWQMAGKLKELEERLGTKKASNNRVIEPSAPVARTTAAPARATARAATKKITYTLDDSSDAEASSPDFNKILEITDKVKTIGNTTSSKPLFANVASASRPSSSHSVNKSRQSRANRSDDEDDFGGLLANRGSPDKPAPKRASEYHEFNEEDDSDSDIPVLSKKPQPKAATYKKPTTAAAKPQPKPVPKVTKKVTQSPAAKAYAKKQAAATAALASKPDAIAKRVPALKNATLAKKKRSFDDSDDDGSGGDSEDDLANEILSDSPPPAVARGRRAAATKKANYAVDEDSELVALDDSDSQDYDQDDESD